MSTNARTQHASGLMRALLKWERNPRDYDIKNLPAILAQIIGKDSNQLDGRTGASHRQGTHRGKQKPRSITP